jgi:hypothetical protein
MFLLQRKIPAQEQEEQKEPVLCSIESHDLQGILPGIDRCLQRLGDSGPDWEGSVQCCSLAIMFCRRGGMKQGKQPFLLILKRNLSSFQLVQRRQKMIQPTLTIHSQGIPLIRNAHIFIFYCRTNVI